MGREGRGEGGRRVVEVGGEPVGKGLWSLTVGKRRSIIATVPAHGMPIAWQPQPSRAHLLFVFVVHTIL